MQTGLYSVSDAGSGDVVEPRKQLSGLKGEDSTLLLPPPPSWPQPRRRSSLITNPLALHFQDSIDERNSLAQYSPAMSSAYGNALVTELRQDDESFFSDKSETKSQAPTLAAALGQRRGSHLVSTTPSSPSSESLGSPKRKSVSRHVSHIGYGQHSSKMSRLRRSSNGDEHPFPFQTMHRRRSHDSAVTGGLLMLPDACIKTMLPTA